MKCIRGKMVADEQTINFLGSIVTDKFIQATCQKDSQAIKDIERYIAVVARSVVSDYFRDNENCPTHNIELIENNHSDTSADLEEIVEQRALLHSLQEKLSKLPEQDQKLIVLFYLQRVPQKVIAQMCGLSEKTVRLKIHRIKQKLKVLMNYDKEE